MKNLAKVKHIIAFLRYYDGEFKNLRFVNNKRFVNSKVAQAYNTKIIGIGN